MTELLVAFFQEGPIHSVDVRWSPGPTLESWQPVTECPSQFEIIRARICHHPLFQLEHLLLDEAPLGSDLLLGGCCVKNSAPSRKFA